MPNPTKISLPRIDYHFEESACEQVLTVMLNKVDKDYSTVDELAEHDELSMFTRDEIKKAVSELNGRKFLLKVDKPYGCVYAVNKLYIPNMEFVYGRWAEEERKWTSATGKRKPWTIPSARYINSADMPF